MLAEKPPAALARPEGDRAVLRLMRLTVLALGAAIVAMALRSSLSIYQLVNESGKVVLVCAFVPLAVAASSGRAPRPGLWHRRRAAAWPLEAWLLRGGARPWGLRCARRHLAV
jgi:hypothetical protein